MTYQWVTPETPTGNSPSGPPENRNPGHRFNGTGAETIFGQINTVEATETAPESLAIKRVAARFRLSIPVARVICELANLGVAA